MFVSIVKEAFYSQVKKKYFFTWIGLFVLFLILAQFFSKMSFGEEQVVLKSLGGGFIRLFVLVFSLFSAQNLLKDPIETQSCGFWLAKDVGRWKYMLARIMGFQFLNIVILFLFSSVWLVLLGKNTFDFSFLLVCLGLYLEAFVLFCWVLLFSLFVSNAFLPILGVSFFIIGHWVHSLSGLMSQGMGKIWSEVLGVIIPSLHRLNWTGYFINDVWLPSSFYFMTVVYSLLWVLVFLIATYVVFRKVDI